MPFKHNAAHRHRIPRARYRVTNWPAYEAGLRRRGDLTLWLDEAALAGWAAPKRSSPGGQPLYLEWLLSGSGVLPGGGVAGASIELLM